MGSHRDDAAVAHEDDPVDAGDHFGSVRDEQHRLVAYQIRQCLLDPELRLGVGQCGRLVEDQNGVSTRMARAVAMRWAWPPDSPLSAP